MFDSFKWITNIVTKLYEAENRRIKKDITNLIEANNLKHSVLARQMVFQGTVYSSLNAALPKVMLPLHEDLTEKGEYLVKDMAELAADGIRIRQALFMLLEPCGYTGHMDQDIRDAIPDCIQDTLPSEIRERSRIRPFEQMLDPGPNHEFVMEVLPRIEFYAAARLFY